MFICHICSKRFTEKRNLTRHAKTHSKTGQTYSCSYCDKSFARPDVRNRHEDSHTDQKAYQCSLCEKTFSRPDMRKRHEESHLNTISCTICGQTFNRQDNLTYHMRTQHGSGQPSRKRKRSPSTEPVGSPPTEPVAKKPRVESPSSKPIVRPEPSLSSPTTSTIPEFVLPEDPDTRDVYVQHWREIDTHRVKGPIQDRYNFVLSDLRPQHFDSLVRSIFYEQTTVFKLNLSFGYILRNIESGELRYFYASFNNNRFLETPYLIRHQEDLEQYLQDFNRQDLLEFIRQQRPDTKWVVHQICNVTFYVNKIIDHVIGSKVILPS